jgi:FO synthase
MPILFCGPFSPSISAEVLLDKRIDRIATSRQRLEREDAVWLETAPLDDLMRAAAWRRDQAHGIRQSFSRKVFIPLTRLCRDVCHYCTFAKVSRAERETPYMSMDQVLRVAEHGAQVGCKEALFTLGDKPELRYALARQCLDTMGYATSLEYLQDVAHRVLKETGLLPHLNPGVMSAQEIVDLRRVSISMGIMLESDSERLCRSGGVHFGSPDKRPGIRLQTISDAGAARVPFTSGILAGIGETRSERISSLIALRELHDQYGHLQEIIVQNFRPKAGTRLEAAPALDLEDHLWTIAAARLIFDADMTIQAPPNLSPHALPRLIAAGINDWGGISPVTPDHVNPEAPWPTLDLLSHVTRACGKHLTERLAIFPSYAQDFSKWVDSSLHTNVLHLVDGSGYPRTDDWSPGLNNPPPQEMLQKIEQPGPAVIGHFGKTLDQLMRGQGATHSQLEQLFEARGQEFAAVCHQANDLRRATNGESVTYVVNRNINYTNICSYRCQFCAFAKGKTTEDLRGKPYLMPMSELSDRVREAWQRGATEVCMQGGIHPSFTGQTYIDICRTAKEAAPEIHVHAFSPLEVTHGAQTLGISLREFLSELKNNGLSTLPGTAAEILNDPVRDILCPDKINTAEWIEVMRTAHSIGIRTTSTIMFGHIESYRDWAYHLTALRNLQFETGGFTEFVPLPFIHMEAPIYRKGRSRKGPTFREAVLMHAVARLTLHPLISNIQASWVKMGERGVQACLQSGANDLGGTLMNESISKAAGASHGQEMTESGMCRIITELGRSPLQRTTLYGQPTGRNLPDRRSIREPILIASCVT